MELRKEYFFHNIMSIMVLAFGGTVISSFAIGGALYYISANLASIPTISFIDCMILGSLISAVDPIATIVVLEKLGVEPTLYILIFGEAVLNDAAAIVINRTFVGLARENQQDDTIGPAAAMMLINAVVSILIGVFCGWSTKLLHKYSSLHKHLHLELASFFLISFVAYVVAETCQVSGVMAILFTGIVADYYTSGYLTPVACTSVHAMTKSLSSMLESFIFVYLGMSLFLTDGQDYQSPAFIFILLGLCLVGRAMCIFPLVFLLNRFRSTPIPFKYQLVMWFSGLRGPVAFALALTVPNHTSLFLTSTLMIIFATTVGIGGVTLPMLKALNLTSSGSGGHGGLVPVYPGYSDEINGDRNQLGEKVDVWWEPKKCWKTAFVVNKRTDGWYEVRIVNETTLQAEHEIHPVPASAIRRWGAPARKQDWMPLKFINEYHEKTTKILLKKDVHMLERRLDVEKRDHQNDTDNLAGRVEKLEDKLRAALEENQKIQYDNDNLRRLVSKQVEELLESPRRRQAHISLKKGDPSIDSAELNKPLLAAPFKDEAKGGFFMPDNILQTPSSSSPRVLRVPPKLKSPRQREPPPPPVELDHLQNRPESPQYVSLISTHSTSVSPRESYI